MSNFRVSWAAAAAAVADAAVLGLLAALVYRASGAHIRNPWLRAVPALLTVVCPVGTETAGSIADLQWAMFFVTIVVLMWNPQRPAAIPAGLLTVTLTTLTNPFGLLLAPLAVVRIATLGRSRGTLIPLATLGNSDRRVRPWPLSAGARRTTRSCPAAWRGSTLPPLPAQGFSAFGPTSRGWPWAPLS